MNWKPCFSANWRKRTTKIVIASELNATMLKGTFMKHNPIRKHTNRMIRCKHSDRWCHCFGFAFICSCFITVQLSARKWLKAYDRPWMRKSTKLLSNCHHDKCRLLYSIFTGKRSFMISIVFPIMYVFAIVFPFRPVLWSSRKSDLIQR